MRRSTLRALAARIEPDPATGCWHWTGARSGGMGRDYGYFWFMGRMMPAHRVMYRVLIGPIPEGLTLDHLCANPPCVNPRHLEPVTHIVNCQRGKRQTRPVVRVAANRRCKYGHWMDEQNTYMDGRGCTRCRQCHAIRRRLERTARRAERLPVGATA